MPFDQYKRLISISVIITSGLCCIWTLSSFGSCVLPPSLCFLRHLCRPCHNREKARGLGKYICQKCHAIIEEQPLIFKNDPYHPDHFNCNNCGSVCSSFFSTDNSILFRLQSVFPALHELSVTAIWEPVFLSLSLFMCLNVFLCPQERTDSRCQGAEGRALLFAVPR